MFQRKSNEPFKRVTMTKDEVPAKFRDNSFKSVSTFAICMFASLLFFYGGGGGGASAACDFVVTVRLRALLHS